MSNNEPVQRISEDLYSISSNTTMQDLNNFKLMLSAQQMRDIYDWCLLHMREIEADATQAGHNNDVMQSVERMRQEYKSDLDYLKGQDEQ